MDESTVSETAAIDDLVSEQLSDTPNEGRSDTSDTQVADSTAPEPVQASAPQEQPLEGSNSAPGVAPEGQTQVSEPTPAPASIRIGDRDYTAQELQAALTSAQQLGHLQNKYVGLLEQSKQWQSQQSQGQNQTQGNVTQAPQPEQYMAQLRAKYDPVVKDLVSKGLIESDFAQLFPGMAAQMLAERDKFNGLVPVIQAVAGELQGRRQQEQSSGVVNGIAQQFNALAQSGEAFTPLKNPETAQKFFNYLYDLNPQMKHLSNPQFLASQWVAFNKDQYLQSAQVNQIQAQRQNQVRYARADATTGTRAPGSMQEQIQTPLDSMVSDFFTRSAG